ncbi:DUF4192 domain-containing protein [Kineococcus gynurae]|uniref:DUF4192 domain-containing protein n=1 Tax=Kineococcus gynurae TaxID=452979 RepID=A0ABV5LV51_9ACTN
MTHPPRHPLVGETDPDHPQPDHPQPVRLTGPDDLLAALPFRLGFHPRRSLVVLALAREDRDGPDELGLCARIDLPLPRDVDPAVRALVGPWTGPDAFSRRDDVAGLVLVAVDLPPPGADASSRDPVHAGGQQALRLTERLLREAGVEVRDVIRTWVDAEGTDRWRDRGCDEATPGCCGPGHVRTSGTAVAAEFVARGVVAAPRRADLVPDLRPLPAAHLRTAEQARSATTPLDVVLAEVLRCHRPGPRPAPEARRCGRLLAAAADGSLALAVVTALAGRGPVRPAPAALEGSLQLLHHLARHLTGVDSGGLLAAAAFVAWWGGRGVLAGTTAEEALLRDPGNLLAADVLDRLARGTPPVWAAREG